MMSGEIGTIEIKLVDGTEYKAKLSSIDISQMTNDYTSDGIEFRTLTDKFFMTADLCEMNIKSRDGEWRVYNVL